MHNRRRLEIVVIFASGHWKLHVSLADLRIPSTYLLQEWYGLSTYQVLQDLNSCCAKLYK